MTSQYSIATLPTSRHHVRRNAPFLFLLAAFMGALVLAGLAGRGTAPAAGATDRRRTTMLHGPAASSGFAAVLERFGVEVEQRRRSFFRPIGGSADQPRTWLAILEIGSPTRGTAVLEHAEVEQVLRYVTGGGSLLIAGATSLERCFGVRRERLTSRDVQSPLDVDQGLNVSTPQWVYRFQEDADDPEPAAFAVGGSSTTRCTPVTVSQFDTLLVNMDSEVVAARLEVQGGGHVIMLSDSRFLSNRALRETDAAQIVIPLLLNESPARVVFDEYHQGFGVGGSILSASFGWMTANPGGWVVLQLTFAAMLGLLAVSIRFGPAIHVVERKRRSPLEHLEALAIGLQRAKGRTTAMRLITTGLRRRLNRGGTVHRVPVGEGTDWFRSLELAARTPAARTAVKRLHDLFEGRNGDEQVLNTAHAVEDVWEALRPENKPSKF